MNHRIFCCCVFVLAASSAACASSQSAPCSAAAADEATRRLSNEELARKILELTHADEIGNQIIEGMTREFRQMPGLPPGFVDRFIENARKERLSDLLVPVYLKNYERDTMLAMVAFYQSKHGKIVLDKLPAVTADSMEAGRTWGRSLAEKTLEEMGLPVPPRQ